MRLKLPVAESDKPFPFLGEDVQCQWRRLLGSTLSRDSVSRVQNWAGCLTTRCLWLLILFLWWGQGTAPWCRYCAMVSTLYTFSSLLRTSHCLSVIFMHWLLHTFFFVGKPLFADCHYRSWKSLRLAEVCRWWILLNMQSEEMYYHITQFKEEM